MKLSRVFRKTLKKSLKVYWWRYEYPNKLNFGDELTPILIQKLFGYRTVWAEPSSCELAGAGSIIEILQQLSDQHHLEIWGSGFIKEGPVNASPSLSFCAVRGLLSKERVTNKNVALGDPGLLMGMAFPEFNKSNKKHKVGLIPHYIDQEHPIISQLSSRPGFKIIDVLDPPQIVAEEINSCELILSSSMHGLIVSDSYNVPNYWLPLNELTGGDYKFKDYYSVFNISPPKVVATDVLQDSSTILIQELTDKYTPRKELPEIQQRLLKSFPF